MVCPIITALFAFLLLKEPISRRKWIALTVSAVSVLVLASGFMREVSWSVGVATLFAIYLVIQREIKQVDKFNLLGVQLLLACLLVLPAFACEHHAGPVDSSFCTSDERGVGKE